MEVNTVEEPEGTGEFFRASDLALGLTYSTGSRTVSASVLRASSPAEDLARGANSVALMGTRFRTISTAWCWA